MAASSLERAVARLQGEGRGWILASVAAGWFFVLGMRFVVPGILPTITADFGASSSAAGFAVTVLWVGYAAMQFPAGLVADRVGERLLLTAGLVLSGAALVGYAFTPTFGLFVVVTGAFGLGTGLFAPPRGTLLSKTYDENVGAAFGLTLAAGSVGAAALPAAAALAVSSLGWRATLGVAAPGFFLAALALWWAVPNTRDAAGGRDNSVREALRGAALAVRDRRIALAAVGATVMLFVFQGVTAFLTTYLVEQKGLTQGTAGAMLGGLFVAGALSQLGCGRLADRYGAPRVLLGVGLVSVLPLAAVPLVEGRVTLAALSALVGVRMSIGPVSNAYIVDLLPTDVQGTAWGALRTGFFFVGSLGSTVVGVMADSGLFDAAFYVLAALSAVGALVYVFLPARPARRPDESATEAP